MREEIKKEKKAEKTTQEWIPKTVIGKNVLSGEIKTLEELLEKNKKIFEPEIVDYLSEPPLEEKIIDVQKTTRVVRAGRKFSFRVAVLVGNKKGIVGLGTAKDKEKWPAAKKASKRAKLNIIHVVRGCGSWECTCNTNHSVPFKVKGKNSSVRVELLPAPKGVGLVAGDTIKQVLEFAGIKDVWSKTRGATDTKLNFARAAIDALKKLKKVKITKDLEKEIIRETKAERGKK